MRLRILIAWVLFAVSTAWSAEPISLVDSTGRLLGMLPVTPRGNERVVPLYTLAKAAAWDLTSANGEHTVQWPGHTVSLRRGNPFAATDHGHVQLRLAPEEWDGSLWIPLSNLRDLFDDDTELNLRQTVLKMRIAPRPPEHDNVAQSPAWTLQTVILDPGHGGKDPGCLGLMELEEKAVTLDIARRLAALLKANGLNVHLTRSDDRFVSLRERTRFANDMRGDLFLSIHCDSYDKPDVRGVETYFLKPARTKRAVEAALRENSVVKLEENAERYQDLTEQNYILLTMATSQYIKDSEAWAAHALGALAAASGSVSRGVDQAGFYVLMGAAMPAVLVECGYLSNSDDALLLATEHGRQKIAEGLSHSVELIKQQLEASASR